MATKEKAEKNMVSFEFKVSAEEFEAAVAKAYKKNVGKINIQGFRKGKAPRAIIERYYGKEVFYEDAVNIVLPDAYDKAIEEQNIEAVAQPEIDVKEISAETGVVFTAKVAVKPEFELGQYKGVKVKKVTHKTTEKEINAEIDRIRERNARLINVEDRAAQKDDTVVIDYEGFVDGVAFAGGKAEGHELKLGSGQFIPGFEDQLVGANIGDDVTVKVTFPEVYHSEELKGKDAEFKVKVHAIKAQELPELDDEFAKDVSEFDTFEDFKADITKKLKENNKKRSQQEFEKNVLDAVAEATEIDIPQAMIDTNVENSIRDFAMQMQYQGIDLNQYMKMTGMTVDALKAQFLPEAEGKVKMSLILEKVAKVENIEVSDEEVEAEYKNIAETNKMELDDVKKYLKAEDLKENKLVEKTVKFLVDNADTSK
ncbi:MAG: trigger factor [Ruminococcaceae bacterium]|nr:trigger factor [Oscillospiraceae bacterium]